jgi:hypothetical protein
VKDNELSDEEFTAFATVFPPGPGARQFLLAAGFPELLIPNTFGLNALAFWGAVVNEVGAGALPGGRHALLAAAHRRYPANPVFASAAPKRVLLVGASPDDEVRIRADRELRALTSAARPGHLAVSSVLAAAVTDLQEILSVRPDLLHLSCHGEGDELIFEDAWGEAQPVSAAQVARTLDLYRAQAGVRLSGLVLGSCDSASIASVFAPVAEVVIAHKGELDDECAVRFAAELYAELNRTPSLAAAARIAAHHTGQSGDEICALLEQRLIVLES